MSFSYDVSYAIPFPILPVVIHQMDGSGTTGILPALIDTGADISTVPKASLHEVRAEQAYTARIRSHWGESWPVAIYLVDLEVADQLLPAIEVVGDDESGDVLLGRNVLNKLILLLDGPNKRSDILTFATVDKG